MFIFILKESVKFIPIYFSLIMKKEYCLSQSRSNPALEPTGTKQLSYKGSFFLQGNNWSL